VVTIETDQLIFTNVEAEQSPTRRRGYQTLFYTHPVTEGVGLTEQEVMEIEARLFYVPREGTPTKHVFFTTSTGKAAVAQIVPLAGTDQFGRTGRYFAHALAFSPETFAQFGHNPFAVFHGFDFWTTVEQALAVGDFATGNIPPMQLSVEQGTENMGQGTGDEWDIPWPERRTLLLLAAQAPRLLEERRAMGFFGPGEEMFRLLETLFPLLPPPVRLRCTFDTLFCEGTLSRLPYWAVGLPADHPRPPNLLPFDLGNRRFADETPCQPATAFERWLEREVERETLARLAERSLAAYALGEWFEGRPAEAGALTGVDEPLFREFVALNRARFESRVRERLTQQVGSALGDRVFAPALAWTEQQGPAAIRALEQGFATEPLRDWIQEAYAEARRRPSPRELADLERWLARQPQAWLRLVCLRWAGKWTALAAALREADEATFRQFAAWALRTVSVRVEWKTQSDEQGVTFGPAVRGEGKEARDLILSLLDQSEASRPAARAPAPPQRSGWLPFGRKAAPPEERT